MAVAWGRLENAFVIVQQQSTVPTDLLMDSSGGKLLPYVNCA